MGHGTIEKLERKVFYFYSLWKEKQQQQQNNNNLSVDIVRVVTRAADFYTRSMLLHHAQGGQHNKRCVTDLD